jgi:hypothetical protein
VKKRRLILLTLALLAAFALTILLWPGEREPEYQGRKLSWFVERYSPHADLFPEAAERNAPLVSAVQQIGTNAIPTLLKWIDYEPPKIEKRIETLLQRAPVNFWRKLFYSRRERR